MFNSGNGQIVALYCRPHLKPIWDISYSGTCIYIFFFPNQTVAFVAIQAASSGFFDAPAFDPSLAPSPADQYVVHTWTDWGPLKVSTLHGPQVSRSSQDLALKSSLKTKAPSGKTSLTLVLLGLGLDATLHLAVRRAMSAEDMGPGTRNKASCRRIDEVPAKTA